jgi:hypothetical protein
MVRIFWGRSICDRDILFDERKENLPQEFGRIRVNSAFFDTGEPFAAATQMPPHARGFPANWRLSPAAVLSWLLATTMTALRYFLRYTMRCRLAQLQELAQRFADGNPDLVLDPHE